MRMRGKITGAVGVSLLSILFSFSGAQAETVAVQLRGMDALEIRGSDNATLTSASISIGWFSSSTPTDWNQITRSNLASYFTRVGLEQAYVPSTTSYSFNGTVPSNGDLKAYLVITGGSSDLGIFNWNNLAGTSPVFLEGGYLSTGTVVDTTVSQDNPDMPNDPLWLFLQASRGFVLGTDEAPVVKLASAVNSVASPVNQNVSFTAIRSKTVGDSFYLTASSDSGLPVVFESSNDKVEVVGNLATIKKSGSATITARVAAGVVGNVSYSSATSSNNFECNPSTVLRVSSLGTPSYSIQSLKTSVTLSFVGNPNATYTIEFKSDLNATNWSSITVQSNSSGEIRDVVFDAPGDLVSTWKNRMFFRAKNS